jgi:hypothetical protein
MNRRRNRLMWLLVAFAMAVGLSLLLLKQASGASASAGGAWRLWIPGAILLAVPLWRKRLQGRGDRSRLQLVEIERLRLDPGGVVFLVEACGERLLLAGSSGGLRLIDRLGALSSTATRPGGEGQP